MRKTNLRNLKLYLAALCLFAGCQAAVAESDSVDFDLLDLKGTPVKLSQLLGGGQWLLVMIWATDCVICMEEKPRISDFHDRYKDTMARVIGIALDGYEKKTLIERFIQKHRTTFPTFTGDLASIARSYELSTQERLRGTPTYLLYTPDGDLVGNNPGPLSDGAIARFIEKYNKAHN